MDNKLIIKDGKFYKNGEIVKPEFGNIEQINLLKAEAHRLELIKKGEYEVEILKFDSEPISWNASLTFVCCYCDTKQTVDIDDGDFEYEADIDDCEDAEISCVKCDTEYIVTKSKSKKGYSLIPNI